MLPRPPRLFVAADLLSGKVRLDNYPFRYICVGPAPSMVVGVVTGGRRAGMNAILDQVLSAVEFLEDRGWSLVNMDQGGTVACLRQTGPPTGVPPGRPR